MFTLATMIGVVMIALSCALEAYYAGRAIKIAIDAWRLANMQKSRIDRMQRTAKVDSKETKIVPYQEGWVPESNWDDDFSRTTFIPPQTLVATRVNWFRKMMRWLKG